MKQNKVLKSLAELSPEVLARQAAIPAEKAPGQSEAVTSETKPTVQPIRVLTDKDTRTYRGWGINE